MSAFMLGVAGCNASHMAQSRGTAPGLATSGDSGYGPSRNLADPNAPFAVMEPAPHLEKRPAILDVNSVPLCAPADLHIWESGADANGNHRSIRYTLSNSGAACRLSGFPAVTLLATAGTVLGSIHLQRVSQDTIAASVANPETPLLADASGSYPSEPVLLVPRGRAGFDIGWTSGPNCQPVSEIVVAAPGSDRSVIIPRQLSVCSDRILISAVSPDQ